MSNLQRAIEIAVEAHREQKQKSGAPYILHPIHLMQQLDSDAEKIVAVLHDVVEDTEVTFADLEREGFTSGVLDAVRLLTRDDDERDYEDYVGKIGANPLARRVKIADLEHNMDIRRLSELGDKDLKRLRKYHRSWTRLKAATDPSSDS